MIGNKSHKQTRRLLVISTVFILGLIAVIPLARAAWTPPISGAPGGNVAAPLNASGTTQTKKGDLTLGGSLTLQNENLFVQSNDRGVFWETTLFEDPHINYSVPMKRLYLSAGDTGDGIELQGDIFITMAGANQGSLTIQSFIPGGCFGNNTIKADANGTLYCDVDLQGPGGGNIDGTGLMDKVAVFEDANTLTYDDFLHWDQTNHRLGIGLDNPSATLDVNGDVRFTDYPNCTLDTDASGNLVCGTDEVGGSSLWENGATANTINPISPDTTQVAIGHDSIADDTQLSVKNNSTNAAIYANNLSGFAGYFSGNLIVTNGSVGLGTTAPTAMLTVGNSEQFQVDTAGDLIRVRDITYSWPNAQGAAGTFLKNDGSGNLSWTATGGSVTGAGTATQVAFWTSNTSLSSNANLYWDNTNSRLGILDSTPAAALTVGNNDLFQVDSAGDMIRIRNIAYSWPNAQGSAGSVLNNDGSGNLSWSSGATDAFTAKITANDTTPDFLGQKLESGAGISLEVVNPGANEQLRINSSGSGDIPAGAADQTIFHNGTAWTATSNLFNNGTNVAIGNTAPTGRFVVNRNAGGTGNAGDAMAIYANTAGSAIYAQQANPAKYAGYFSGKTVVMNGNFGLGTPSPSQKYTQSGGNMVHRYDTSDWIEPLPALDLGGPETYGLEFSSKYMFIAQGSRGIRVIDISNPTTPVLINTYSQVGWGYYTIKVSGKYAYVRAYKSSAPQRNELDIFDISNPYDITLAGSLLNLEPFRMDIAGKYLYTTENYGLNAPFTSRLKIIDISNPAAPVQVGQSAILDYKIDDIDIAGRYAYVSATEAGVRIFDISNPANPTLISTTPLTTIFGWPGYAHNAALSGSYLYVGGGTSDALFVLDVKNPNAPVVLYNGDQLEEIKHVFVSGKYLYCQRGNQFIYIYDIRNPSSPVRLIGAGDWGWLPTHIYVYGGYIYVADYRGYLQTIEIPHLDTPAITTGNIEASQIIVSEDADIAGSVNIRSALQVGRGGIKSDGPIQSGDVSFWNRFRFTELDEQTLSLQNPDNDDMATFHSSGNVGIGQLPGSDRLTINGELAVTQLWQPARLESHTKISNALQNILALEGDSNNIEGRTEYQIDPDALKRVLPELVRQTDSSTAVSELDLVPILLEALKDQQDQLETLELRMNTSPKIAL